MSLLVPFGDDTSVVLICIHMLSMGFMKGLAVRSFSETSAGDEARKTVPGP